MGNFKGLFKNWADVPRTIDEKRYIVLNGMVEPEEGDTITVCDMSDWPDIGDEASTLAGIWVLYYHGKWSNDGVRGWIPERYCGPTRAEDSNIFQPENIYGMQIGPVSPRDGVWYRYSLSDFPIDKNGRPYIMAISKPVKDAPVQKVYKPVYFRYKIQGKNVYVHKNELMRVKSSVGPWYGLNWPTQNY